MLIPPAEPGIFQIPPAQQVSVSDPGKALAWCVEFQCTPAQLETAVRWAGTDPAAVKRELAGQRRGIDDPVLSG